MKYIITSEKWAGELELDFDDHDRLIFLHLRAQLTPEAHEYLLNRIPLYRHEVEFLKTEFTKITEVPVDVSFENFYRRYNYRERSSKIRSEKLWNALPVHQQLAAINYISVYDAILAQGTISKKYAETYLTKKEWIK